ncbi:hypothetical protein AMK68_03025 [candidate division KD3-62 bacterium DG_56]|uniref:Fibronectin type-III domain-containing protein n=1 Tax=candidate division KD3-62 bacterium DG_56 TaxID=1704032 RepID=A0A0S7XMW6_9BACT|nr:MAG: hypothetical protein AMK68_03025 [candidate division KD3-62 bacterium DG_56]
MVDSVILTFDLPPTGLLAQATSATEVDLTWSDNSDYDSGYEVERRAASGSFQRIATLAANATAYTDGNASPSTTYEYRVRGLNAAGFTAYSDITTTTTPPDTAPRPLGSVTAVAADPSRLGYAYAASADVGLIVFDVSAAASPRAVAAAALPVSSQPAGLKVSGDLAVIPARHVVAVYDLGEPTAPVRVATITVPAVDVAIMGDYLYLCDEYNGLVTFDVSDPWNPRQQATVLPVMGYEMDVAGGDIWVAALSELRGVATQPPWSPSLLGFVPTSICQVVCGTPAHAFVFSGAALRVIDVADPLRPLEVGSLTTDAVRLTSLSALNQQVCATWYYQALASRGLWMYDVSDPTRPVLLSNVWTQGGAYDVSAIEVGPHDKRCYVADGTAGFTVVDVTDPTRPRVVGNCRTM